MAVFLIWSLVFVLVECSENYLNLTKNFQLLGTAYYSLETQKIQINEFRDCLFHLQYPFTRKIKIQIAQVYSEYLAILKRNMDKRLLTRGEIERNLDISSFQIEPKLQNVLLNQIFSMHYLLYPKGGFFNTRGLTLFVLKAHLYLRQMSYMKKGTEFEWGIYKTIDSLLHQILFGWPELSNEERLLLETTQSINESYQILWRFDEVVEEKEEREEEEEIPNDLKKTKRHKFLGNKPAKTKRYNRKGIYIGLIYMILFVSLFLYLRMGFKMEGRIKYYPH